ncbi:MBL fold metallo-hydrolase [Granulosicoccaceae sp. 1_MG-2023]|nr:MBL fold metallo-hydrolase [Granulosicoccaceae sp. 1_MG-2023]
MIFRQLINTSSLALSYLLADKAGGDAILIDPQATQYTLLQALISEYRLHLKWTLLTHQHRAVGNNNNPFPDVPVLGPQEAIKHSGQLHIGSTPVQVIPTPGHTHDDVCYLWHDRLFCGDTLHPAGCPAPNGESLPGSWYDSVNGKLFTLPDETLVFPGHLNDGRTVSTILEERRRNAVFGLATRDLFIARVNQLADNGLAPADPPHPGAA